MISLRLSEKEELEILSSLEYGHGNSVVNQRRQNRLPYVHRASLVIQMCHSGASQLNYLLRARNLSAEGIGFLHGSFVYTGTACVVSLLNKQGKPVRIEGRVVRCKHVRKHVHEV